MGRAEAGCGDSGLRLGITRCRSPTAATAKLASGPPPAPTFSLSADGNVRVSFLTVEAGCYTIRATLAGEELPSTVQER